MARRQYPVLLLLAIVGCGGSPPPVERRAPSGPAIYLLTVQHESQMSQSFRLVALTVIVDGRVVLQQNVDGEDGDAEIEAPVCALREMVQAGSHEVRVELLYRGRGHGVFSYLSDYRFTVRSEHLVDVPPNAFGVHVKSIGEENGGATTPLEDRPSIRWVDAIEHEDPNAGCRP